MKNLLLATWLLFTAVLPITLSGQCVSSSAPSGVSGTLSICSGSSTSLTVSGGTLGTGAQWKWYTGSCGGTLIDSGAVITVSPTTTKAYWVRAEGGSCSSTTACATATVTVNAVPAAPTKSIDDSTVCSGVAAGLRGYSVGNTILWYTQSSGGSAVDSTASHSYYWPIMDTSVVYYIEAKSSAGCVSATRTALPVTALPVPPAPNAPTSNSPNCGQVTLTRVGTPPSGQTWYFGSGFNMTIHNGNHGSTYVVTSSGTYYIHSRYDATGCWGLDTVTISVVVKPRPAAPDSIYSNSPQCQGTGVTLTVVGGAPAGQTWYWQPRTVRYYTTDTGATYTVGSTSVPCIKSLDTVGCWSDDKCIGATVNPRPAAPTAATPSTATSVCSAANLSISATSTGNSIDWYTQSSGGSLLGSAASGAGLTVNPTTGGAFYAASRSAAGCVSSTRKATGVVSILSLPAAPTAPAPQSACSDTAYTFVFDSVLAGSGGNQIEWSRYSSFDSSTVVSSGSDIYFTVNAGETDTLWLRSRASATGCVSGGVGVSGRVNLRPEELLLTTTYATYNNTTHTFFVDSIKTKSIAERVEWSYLETMQDSISEVAPVNLQFTINNGYADTIWLWKRNILTGCVSKKGKRIFDTRGSVFECHSVDSTEEAPQALITAGSATACSERENYAPDNSYPDHRPIVTVYVNFHFISRSDSTGMWNERNNGTVAAKDSNNWDNGYYMAQVFLNGFGGNVTNPDTGYANWILANTGPQICPASNNFPVTETQYRYEIYTDPNDPNDKGVYFHHNDTDYLAYNWGINSYYKSKYSVHKQRVLDIFLTGYAYNIRDSANNVVWLNDRCSTPGGCASGAPAVLDAMSVSLANYWCQQFENGNWVLKAVANLINHEAGHCLGLPHTDWASNTCEDTNDSCLCFGSDCANGTVYPPNNNIMAYGSQQVLSPCQIATLHKNFVNWQYLAVSDPNLIKVDFCEITDPDLIIDAPGQTILWNSARNMTSNIIIKDGTTLHITCTVGMPKDAAIIIDSGAKLMVTDGGTITNICGSMWDGIIVKGQKNMPQDLTTSNNLTAMSNNQGFVYLQDAHIENAFEAISVWNPADGWVSQNVTDNQGETGGIIRALNTTFLNNRISVAFNWYQNFEYNSIKKIYKLNKSYFHKCDFITNDDHVEEHPFIDHVNAWGVNGIPFLGCHFSNDHTNITSNTLATELGDGIITIDAGIGVDDFINGNTQNGVSFRRSEFKNLQHGVYVSNAASVYKVIVKHAEFKNCLRGIRNENVNLAKFVGNDFIIGGNPASDPTGFLFQYDEGIILHHATGFVVEQNHFTNAASPTHITIGIRSDETGPDNNRIYKNILDNVYAGNVANRQNTNGSSQFPSGLRYECNTHSSNDLYDICVTGPSGTPQLGVKARQEGSNGEGSGNSFTSGTPQIAERDFYNSGVGIDYYHDGVLLPVEKSASVNTSLPLKGFNTCLVNYTFPTTDNPNGGGCSTCLTYSGYSNAYTTHKAAEANYKGQYLALIDGGNTAARKTMVDTVSNANRLKDSLALYSPNLSSVLLDKVARKGLLNDTVRYEVMKANAEGVSYEVYDYLENRLNLPQWMLDSISVARANLTLRSFLLDTLTYHTEQREQAIYAVLRLIQEDSAGFNLSTYRQWLDSSDGMWAKREMVNTYLHEAKYDTIATMLAHYDTLIEKMDSAAFANYNDYATAYASWMLADSSVMKLDSVHKAALLSIAEIDEHKRGSNAARNSLNFFYDSSYFTPGVLPDEQYNKKGGDDEPNTWQEPQQLTLKELPSIKLYPNPAKDAATIEYNAIAEGSKLYVSDAMGVLHEMRILISEKGKIVLNTVNYTNGVYLVRVETGGSSPLKSKFVIIK